MPVCQHGPTECNFNVYEACTLLQFDNDVAGAPMLSCMEAAAAQRATPDQALSSCAPQFQVDPDAISSAYNQEG